MKEELIDQAIKIAKKLEALVSKSNKNLSKDEREHLADEIILFQIGAAKVVIDLEQQYRLRVRQLKEQGESYASAENTAKTEKEWALFKKIEMLYELAEEKVRIIKIMMSSSY